MSIKLMSLAFDARVSNPLRKLVLLKLCDHANDKGQCWPSFSYIADQCEISRRSAINHVQALIEDGYLSSASRFKDGEQTTNMYTVSIARLIKNIAEFAPPSANAAPGVVQMATLGGAGAAPRTTIEPSLLTINESNLAPQADADLLAGLDDSKPDKQKKEVAPKFKPESLADQMPSPLCDWWLKWVDYRRDRKLTTREKTMQAQADNLAEWGKSGLDPCMAIKASIDNGWQGLFPPKPQGAVSQYKTAAEKEAERNAYTFDLERARNF